MSVYTTINILDMIDYVGENEVRLILSDFNCPKNAEVENFVKNNAIEFAKKKMSITYFVMDEQRKLIAIFTLAHKALEIENRGLSESARKKVTRYARLNETTDSYLVSAFLIAQFAKNFNEECDNQISGIELMKNTMSILTAVQREIGGGIVYLECDDNPKLLSFYQNENNGFRIFGKRFSETDNTEYIRLLRFF